jgi:hypothetical protein
MTKDGSWETCGCGKPTRYTKINEDGTQEHSCNKYGRCPTYDELCEMNQIMVSLLSAYREKRNVDGLNGRSWDEEAHYRAEARIVHLEKKMN